MDVKNRNYNLSVACIRIVAMVFIFTDHAVAYCDIPLKNVIAQVGNSGNLIFLFISGFLYGEKTIGDFHKWIKGRAIRLWIPYICFIVIYFLGQFLKDRSLKKLPAFFVYSFVLQGLLGTEGGPLTLWFMTLLIICYCLIPALQRIRSKVYGMHRKQMGVIIFLILCGQVALAYGTNITLDFGHPLSWYWVALFVFSAGYFSNWVAKNEDLLKKFLCGFTIAMPIAMVIRILVQRFLDNTVLYDRIVSIWTNVVLDFWVIFAVYYFVNKLKNKLPLTPICWMDNISYYFYLVHATVLEAVSLVLRNSALFIMSGFICSLVMAMLLKKISGVISKRLIKQ